MKKFKVFNKNLLLGTLVLTTVTMTGCKKEETIIDSSNSYDKIYATYYNDSNRVFEWREVRPQEEYITELESYGVKDTDTNENGENVIYIASYQALGYQAASTNETKKDAIENNSEYSKHEEFLEGFELGKQDSYLTTAEVERRQYVAIKETEKEDNTEETYYYPLEDLTVVSYNGANALVTDYNEDAVKVGNYKDILGKDMSEYVGDDFVATSLRNFATKYPSLPDSAFIAPAGYDVIPEITITEFPQDNELTPKNTK